MADIHNEYNDNDYLPTYSPGIGNTGRQKQVVIKLQWPKIKLLMQTATFPITTLISA